MVNEPYDSTNQDVLYTSRYIVRRPIFYSALNEFGNPEQVLDFQESTVRYTKIKTCNSLQVSNNKLDSWIKEGLPLIQIYGSNRFERIVID